MSTRETWLITGATGQLGGHLLYELERLRPQAAVTALCRRETPLPAGAAQVVQDLGDVTALRELVRRLRPRYVVHTGAMTSVAQCYRQQEAAQLVNTEATEVLAETTVEVGGRFVFTSTDMVFAGDDAPYCETDEPRPLSFYGRSKVLAERAVGGLPRALTVRVPLLFGLPRTARRTTFVDQVEALRAGRPLRLFTDEYRTPMHLADAARALIELAVSDVVGLIHVAGPDRLSRYELIERTAAALGIARPVLEACSRLSIDSPEPRPADLSLDASLFARLFPHFAARRVEECVAEYRGCGGPG